MPNPFFPSHCETLEILNSRSEERRSGRSGMPMEKTDTNTMDDVDRLFQCFKCGISPPQSALRAKKVRKGELRQQGKTVEASTPSGILFQGSPGKGLAAVTNTCHGKEKSSCEKVKASKIDRGKQFSPVVFYGSPLGIPPKRPLSIFRLLREIRVDLNEEKKSNIRREVWATFPRQDEAMKFAKEDELARVFSYQDHYSGQRRYLVSTYEEFWRRYKRMDPKYRHHYEVIQEGLPCHLYFDLEFNTKDNAGKDGDEMVDILISIVLEALCEKYSIEGNQNWVVELDSSTKGKFSRHLIINIPKIAFKDNSHAGAFVSEICSKILNANEVDERLRKLFVQKESGGDSSTTHLFVDTAVYSRNRCFRLALSSKSGKTSILLPTARFKCRDMKCEEEVFMASLICNTAGYEKLLVCKVDLDCAKTLRFDTEVNCNPEKYLSPQLYQMDSFGEMPASYSMGKSPFPYLDDFIESIATVGNVSGKIRCWYWFSEHALIVYSMSRNRYCERIGRQHKSNHVMYVVDLKRAVYYQKCYDPDCRGYRSPLRLVPDYIIPEPPDPVDPNQVAGDGESLDSTQHRQVTDGLNGYSCTNSEENFGSASKEAFWLEAIKVAEDIEKRVNTLDVGHMELDDEDESWWRDAESLLSQAEQAGLGPIEESSHKG